MPDMQDETERNQRSKAEANTTKITQDGVLATLEGHLYGTGSQRGRWTVCAEKYAGKRLVILVMDEDYME